MYIYAINGNNNACIVQIAFLCHIIIIYNSWYYGTVMVPTCTHTRLVSPCFQSSVYSLTSMDGHTCDHAVVDDYHTVCIYM